MKLFSGLDYLKIDIANSAGQDKLNFEDKITWFDDNIPESVVTMSNEELAQFVLTFDEPDSIELLYTGLLAYQDYWFKRPSGYMCQLDAVCSGISLMSCLLADTKGLENTGLLGNNRADLYSAVYRTFTNLVGTSINKKRADIKEACMTFAYGSKQVPNRVFENNKVWLNAFYKAMEIECSGALALQQLLTNLWNPKTTSHNWIMPDGFMVHLPVITEQTFTTRVSNGESEIEIPFTLKVHGTKKTSVSNCANFTHSFDSMLMREMVRRTNFNQAKYQEVLWYLYSVIDKECNKPISSQERKELGKLGFYIDCFEQSKWVSVGICDEINHKWQAMKLSKEHRGKLIPILELMLKQGNIDIELIHDCVKFHPDNGNFIRYWYKEMCADLIDSECLTYVINQIVPSYHTNDPVSKKYRTKVANQVRESNYGLC